MFAVYESIGIARRSFRAEFSTFFDACDYVRALDPICFEIDADHPGCADAYTAGGMIYVIESRVAA